MIHKTTCARIRRIEYFENGATKAIEFHSPAPVTFGGAVAGLPDASTIKSTMPPMMAAKPFAPNPRGCVGLASTKMIQTLGETP